MAKLTNHSFTLPISLHFDLIVPDDAGDGMPLVIALHGYGENKTKITELLSNNLKSDLVLASLQAPFPHIASAVLPGRPVKYGFGWITSFNPKEAVRLHHKAIEHILETVKKRDDINITKLILFGFSQSVALNFRYIFSNPGVIDGVIAICGGIPGDWRANNKYKASSTDVLYLGCDRDIFYPPAVIKKNSQLIQSKCRSLEVHFYKNKHEIPSESFEEISRFIKKYHKF